MQIPTSFEELFKDISQDWSYALQNSTTDEAGHKFWRNVAYATPTGFRPLMLDLVLPKGNKLFPLVVNIHGGAWLSGHRNVASPIYRKLDYIMKMVNAGFAVSSISYRFTNEGTFPMQLHDCKAALRFF